MSRLEFRGEAARRFWRLRRGMLLMRMGLIGVFAAALVHLFGA